MKKFMLVILQFLVSFINQIVRLLKMKQEMLCRNCGNPLSHFIMTRREDFKSKKDHERFVSLFAKGLFIEHGLCLECSIKFFNNIRESEQYYSELNVKLALRKRS